MSCDGAKKNQSKWQLRRQSFQMLPPLRKMSWLDHGRIPTALLSYKEKDKSRN
jgi:hypothetical protein